MAITSSQYFQPTFSLNDLPPELVGYILKLAIRIEERLAGVIPTVCKLWKEQCTENLFGVRMEIFLKLASTSHVEKSTAARELVAFSKFAYREGRLAHALTALNQAELAVTDYNNSPIKRDVVQTVNRLKQDLPKNTSPLKGGLPLPPTSDNKENCPSTSCCPVNVRDEREKALRLAKASSSPRVPVNPIRLQF